MTTKDRNKRVYRNIVTLQCGHENETENYDDDQNDFRMNAKYIMNDDDARNLFYDSMIYGLPKTNSCLN